MVVISQENSLTWIKVKDTPKGLLWHLICIGHFSPESSLLFFKFCIVVFFCPSQSCFKWPSFLQRMVLLLGSLIILYLNDQEKSCVLQTVLDDCLYFIRTVMSGASDFYLYFKHQSLSNTTFKLFEFICQHVMLKRGPCEDLSELFCLIVCCEFSIFNSENSLWSFSHFGKLYVDLYNLDIFIWASHLRFLS